MLFNSFTYLLFLPIVVGLYWLLPVICRRSLLLIASYVFYMNWIPAYGLLIVALTVVNYFLGLGIAQKEHLRKKLLVLGLVFNLFCLCFFKYANFLLDSLWHLAGWSKNLLSLSYPLSHDPWVLNILLPLGISFFTFEFIHYITDVYRGSAPVKNFAHFALFAVFFPSQIAGPIKRYQDFNQQMLSQPQFKAEYFQQGLFLIFLGLFKKIVLGDNLGHVVTQGFSNPQGLGTIDAWLAVAGFTIQIFFDFSGYTDIGRGSALLFGYKVPINFNWPFLSSNLTEFWRRWHISLSTWLRDYLFIPLGGNRVGPWRQRFNVFLTMVLGGLWHGAAWHYVIWGAFHGAGLVFSKEWQDLISRIPALAKLRPHPLWHYAGVAWTMFFLFMAGVLFRSDNMPHAWAMTQRLFALNPSGDTLAMFLTSTLPASLTVYAFFLYACHLHDRMQAGSLKNQALISFSNTLGSWWTNSIAAQAVTYCSLSLVILGFAAGKVAPFIYFQF